MREKTMLHKGLLADVYEVTREDGVRWFEKHNHIPWLHHIEETIYRACQHDPYLHQHVPSSSTSPAKYLCIDDAGITLDKYLFAGGTLTLEMVLHNIRIRRKLREIVLRKLSMQDIQFAEEHRMARLTYSTAVRLKMMAVEALNYVTEEKEDIKKNPRRLAAVLEVIEPVLIRAETFVEIANKGKNPEYFQGDKKAEYWVYRLIAANDLTFPFEQGFTFIDDYTEIIGKELQRRVDAFPSISTNNSLQNNAIDCEGDFQVFDFNSIKVSAYQADAAIAGFFLFPLRSLQTQRWKAGIFGYDIYSTQLMEPKYLYSYGSENEHPSESRLLFNLRRKYPWSAPDMQGETRRDLERIREADGGQNDPDYIPGFLYCCFHQHAIWRGYRRKEMIKIMEELTGLERDDPRARILRRSYVEKAYQFVESTAAMSASASYIAKMVPEKREELHEIDWMLREYDTKGCEYHQDWLLDNHPSLHTTIIQ